MYTCIHAKYACTYQSNYTILRLNILLLLFSNEFWFGSHPFRYHVGGLGCFNCSFGILFWCWRVCSNRQYMGPSSWARPPACTCPGPGAPSGTIAIDTCYFVCASAKRRILHARAPFETRKNVLILVWQKNVLLLGNNIHGCTNLPEAIPTRTQ